MRTAGDSLIAALVSGVGDLVDERPESAPDRTQVAVSGPSQDSIEVTARDGANETEIVNRLMMNLLRLSERIGVRSAPQPAEEGRDGRVGPDFEPEPPKGARHRPRISVQGASWERLRIL